MLQRTVNNARKISLLNDMLQKTTMYRINQSVCGQVVLPLTIILTSATMDLYGGECRSRSDCTYVQSVLDLPSPLLDHYFLSTKYHPVPSNKLPCVCLIAGT